MSYWAIQSVHSLYIKPPFAGILLLFKCSLRVPAFKSMVNCKCCHYCYVFICELKVSESQGTANEGIWMPTYQVEWVGWMLSVVFFASDNGVVSCAYFVSIPEIMTESSETPPV